MWYEVRVFHCPRSVDHPKEYEDAVAASLDGFAAISDGVASAIFSRVWSRLLVDQAVEFHPDFSDTEGFAKWLAGMREQWREKIDVGSLGYFQKMKLQRVGGAFATLMTLDFRFPTEDNDEGVYDCRVFGDCCLFHERNGELLSRFPMETSSQFQEAPSSLGSTDQGMDDQLEFSSSSNSFQVGDRLFLTTDAIGEWIYKELENDSPVNWDGFSLMDPDSWRDFVVESRNRSDGFKMTVDDSTMMVIEINSKPDFESSSEGSFLQEIPAADESSHEECESADCDFAAESENEAPRPVDVDSQSDAFLKVDKNQSTDIRDRTDNDQCEHPSETVILTEMDQEPFGASPENLDFQIEEGVERSNAPNRKAPRDTEVLDSPRLMMEINNGIQEPNDEN